MEDAAREVEQVVRAALARIRPAAAGLHPDADDEEMAVLVVQSRESDPNKLALLADRLQEKIHAEFGIQCLIELVTPHTLPRTSSGKLSRSSARKEFVERRRQDDDESPTCFITDEKLFRSVVRTAAPQLALTAGG